jgi:hypothetical protein
MKTLRPALRLNGVPSKGRFWIAGYGAGMGEGTQPFLLMMLPDQLNF